jgi:hypothetical protein
MFRKESYCAMFRKESYCAPNFARETDSIIYLASGLLSSSGIPNEDVSEIHSVSVLRWRGEKSLRYLKCKTAKSLSFQTNTSSEGFCRLHIQLFSGLSLPCNMCNRTQHLGQLNTYSVGPGFVNHRKKQIKKIILLWLRYSIISRSQSLILGTYIHLYVNKCTYMKRTGKK